MAGSLDDTLVACFVTWFVPRPGNVIWLLGRYWDILDGALSI